MRRDLLVVALAVAASAPAARGGIAAPARSAAEKFAASAVVVTGKVTAVEKDAVEVESPRPGLNGKVTYRLAVLTIDSRLAGAEGLKEIRFGFVPPVKPDPKLKRPPPLFPPPEVTAGAELLVFLTKHPTADFYVMWDYNPPAAVTKPEGKQELEEAKAFAAAVADPLKGLKSDKAEVRAKTAAMLVVKYRITPDFAGPTEAVAVDAEENRLVLRALADADWGRGGFLTTPLATVYQLGLTEKDGWKPPVPMAGEDYNAVHKAAYVKWLDGPGKDYRLKKVVPTKK